MGITVYTTSVTCNRKIPDCQDKILHFLDSNDIKYEVIDLSVHTEARQVMLDRIPENKKGDSNILPPQVFSDNQYCGDYDCFFNANEVGLLFTFFKLDPPFDSREERLLKKYKEEGTPIQF